MEPLLGAGALARTPHPSVMYVLDSSSYAWPPSGGLAHALSLDKHVHGPHSHACAGYWKSGIMKHL